MKKLILALTILIIFIYLFSYLSKTQRKEHLVSSHIPLAHKVNSTTKNHYTHQIDPNVWLPQNTRWPSGEKKVHVYFNNDIAPEECNELKQNAVTFFSQKDEYGKLDLGVSCNKFIVLFNEIKFEHLRTLKEFISAHEAFHIAAQFYGKSMVVQMFDIGDSYKSVKSFYYLLDFISLLKKTYPITTPQNQIKHCTALTQYVNKLSDHQRNILLTRAMYEWPAEYYAKQTVFGKNDKEYIETRNEIGKSYQTEVADKNNGIYWDKFYLMSHPIIEEVEKKISTLEWQTRVAQGESILDIYLKQKNCSPFTDTWKQVYVKFKPLTASHKNIVISPL